MHRTVECNARPEVKYCINCKSDSHMASDRNCVIFKKECEKMLNRYPENRYRYFPLLSDPSTWELTGRLTEAQPGENDRTSERQASPPTWTHNQGGGRG